MNVNLIKSGIQLVSGFGVGLIADEAIKMVKPQHLTGLKKNEIFSTKGFLFESGLTSCVKKKAISIKIAFF